MARRAAQHNTEEVNMLLCVKCACAAASREWSRRGSPGRSTATPRTPTPLRAAKKFARSGVALVKHRRMVENSGSRHWRDFQPPGRGGRLSRSLTVRREVACMHRRRGGVAQDRRSCKPTLWQDVRDIFPRRPFGACFLLSKIYVNPHHFSDSFPATYPRSTDSIAQM